MALRVNSNVAALNALRHLNHTEKELSRNLERPLLRASVEQSS